MKKISLLIVTALFAFTNGAWAQNDNDDTEITVTSQKGENEVIDLPEALSYEYDSLLSVYNAKTYIRPNANCDMPDVNPIYEKEVYKERLSRIPAVIEMPYNDVVQKLIDRYSGHLRRSVSLMLGTQNFYMPIFEQALESYGLPLELKYLPVIEEKQDTFLFLTLLFPFFPDDMLCILAGLTSMPTARFAGIMLLARPWGLIFAALLGSGELSLPAWGWAVLVGVLAVIFVLAMKYSRQIEERLFALVSRLSARRRK